MHYELNGKKYKYYPDFYIKSKNLIVEVKSRWTYDRKGTDSRMRYRNDTKHQACIDRGLLFEFLIF